MLIKSEIFRAKYPNLLQINTEYNSQLELLLNIITGAITANRPIEQNIVEIRSNQSMITEKNDAQRSQQNTSASFKSQAQTACYFKSK